MSDKRHMDSMDELAKRSGNKIQLMSLDYRLIHFAAIISLGALLVTGSSEHGFSLLNFHIYFGIFCSAFLGIYGLLVFVKHRLRLFDGLKQPFGAQLKEGFSVVEKYTLGIPYPLGVKQNMGRYNVLASYSSLVLVLSFVPLLIGGVAMSFFVQRGTFLYEEMKALHLLGVGLIALFFLVHIFAVFSAENRPLLKAMFYNGQVALDWAREHLAKYVSKVDDQS